MIYGMEANIVDDGVPIAYNPAHRLLEDTYVVVLKRQVCPQCMTPSLSLPQSK